MFQPEHTPTGVVCMICGMHASRHRKRGERGHRIDNRSRRSVDRIIGIDGEGIGRNPHRYIYLAGSDEAGVVWETSRLDCLSTELCLEFLCHLPRRSLVVGFALGYDVAKWLQDLPDRAIYLLMHEELRQRLTPDGRIVYKPILWNGFRINYMNKRFTVGYQNSKRSTTVWDIFRFFQSSFVKALEAWKICPQSEIDEISRMKDVRSELETKSREEIHAYCQKECLNLAKLARALIEAHKAAGLELKSYFGAGSTASVFLARQGIAEKRGEVPEEMRLPIACSFFGGRFENSYVGAISEPVFSYDISSAYPYQTANLPCLLCGHWRNDSKVKSSTLQHSKQRLHLVHWRTPTFVRNDSRWGGLPVRTRDGTIVFPLGARGGWTWGQEFQAAQELNPLIEATEVWTYETDCNHRPFADVPRYYRERVALGKDAKGIVLKLGINSIYGKLAQSKGVNPPFQCWVWAAVITSNTRAQLLRAVAASPSSILMLATDGVYSRSRLKLDLPSDTGTWDLEKPLGGWEEKVIDQGVFCVRPGIYFPLNPTIEQIQQVRGRGLGRKSLFDNWQSIVAAWQENKPSIEIGNMTRFIGAKSGILKSSQGLTRRDCYGEWIDHMVKVSFAPQPKRRSINSDGTLEPWGYLDFESSPYDPATLSNEAIMLKLAEMIAEEQPDADFSDTQ